MNKITQINEAYQSMYESKLDLNAILKWQDNHSHDGLFGLSRKDGDNIDIEYTVRKDGWLRKVRNPGKDFGLPIRKIKLKKFYETRSDFETYTCNVTFLPTSEDVDDKSKYEKMVMVLWVHKDIDVNSAIQYIEDNMGKWVP